MKVLVVIPILNPPEWFLSDVVGMLQHQSISPKILLINSAKKIEAGEYEVINISKKEFNHANTRNIALGYEADFYLFMTQDAIPYDEYLVENLLKSFIDEDVVVAYAKQIPYDNANPIEVFARTTNYPKYSTIKSKESLSDIGIKTFFNSDSCAMYRGNYFKNVKGFKKDLNTNEDMEFTARAILDDKKVMYCAEAKVYHSHNFTLLQIWKRYSEIGKFFKNNSWILDYVSKYKNTEATGVQQALKEIQYLLQHNPHLVLKSIVISFVKYIAYKSNS